MDDFRFAHQLSSWLDPLALIDSARRVDNADSNALADSVLFIGGNHLQDGNDGRFSRLVEKFLHGYQTPQAVLHLLDPLRLGMDISDRAWEWLAKLTFPVRVVGFPKGTGAHPQAILSISGPDAALDVIQAPILALQELVGKAARQWQEVGKLANQGAQFFHEPSDPFEFFSYIDREVASSYVKFMSPPESGMKTRYRAVTVYGDVKPTDPIWAVAREVAIAMAESTRKPIKDSHGR